MAELKVLTFNVWGLAFVSKDRQARLHAIANYLASAGAEYDIVSLQEIWIHKEFEEMRGTISRAYPYSRFFHTGALGSGLAIFSKLPMTEAKAMPYSLSGLPSEVIAGDFFVNKAAGRVVVAHPVVGEIEVWNTHMHAGSEAPPETRQAHRVAQAWQLATEVRRGAATGRYIFCMGDFNSQPYSAPIALLKTYGGLNDSFVHTHPHANEAVTTSISPTDALTTLGMTCDSPLNTWSHGKNIPPNITAQGGKRLDYIFYREGRGAGYTVSCVNSEVVLTGCVPGKPFSYSDHFGLTSTFRFESRTKATNTSGSTAQHPLLVDDDRQSSSSGLSRAYSAGETASAVRQALATMRDYTSMATKMKRKWEQLAVVSIIATIALAVGSAWQPKSWIQPIFTILAFALGIAGTTVFYFGWLWGRWERGMLDETMADMELELSALSADRRGR